MYLEGISIIIYSVKTKKGTQRAQNQDAYLVEKTNNYLFFAVADGIAGLDNGEKASSLAISTIKNEVQQNNFDLEDIIKKAHDSIQKQAEQNQKTMATTIVLCRIEYDTGEVTVAHVGDSRAYLMNVGCWRTKDHSPVQDLIDLGILTEENMFGHPELHRMTQALGIKDTISIDCSTTTMQQGTILLCSDGLHNYLRDKEIQEIATKNPLEKAIDLLMKKARKNGSTDDITIIVIKLQELATEKQKKIMKTKFFTMM